MIAIPTTGTAMKSSSLDIHLLSDTPISQASLNKFASKELVINQNTASMVENITNPAFANLFH